MGGSDPGPAPKPGKGFRKGWKRDGVASNPQPPTPCDMGLPTMLAIIDYDVRNEERSDIAVRDFVGPNIAD